MTATPAPAEPVATYPVVDRNRCGGHAACVAVCPHQVFSLAMLTETDRAGLSLRGRLKALVRGGRQAYAERWSACQGCGRCVIACPENAIRLQVGRPDSG